MLKKVCKWLGDKFSSIFTLLYGSPRDDIRPEVQESSSQEQLDLLKLKIDNYKEYPCQFCHQGGKDRFKTGPCRVCSGLGTVRRHYQKAIECRHCHGKGVKSFQSQQCKVCGGIGVIERIEESLHKSTIPIIYSSPERSGERLDIPLSNKLSKSIKKEQL